MSQTFYNFRFRKIKVFIKNKAPILSFLIPIVDGDEVSYEQFTKDLSVEYPYNVAYD
jgi:hypothetical protein